MGDLKEKALMQAFSVKLVAVTAGKHGRSINSSLSNSGNISRSQLSCFKVNCCILCFLSVKTENPKKHTQHTHSGAF